MSAIPYVACATFTACLGLISETILQTKILSRKNLRKLFNLLGLLVPSIFIICLSFVNCSLPYLGVAFLTIGLAFKYFYLITNDNFA